MDRPPFQDVPCLDLSPYETLENLAPVGIFFTDVEGNCLHVNRRWCEIAGVSPEQAMGQGWVQAVFSEDLERVASLWSSAVRNRQPFHAEYRYARPGGTITWVVGEARAVQAEDDSVKGYTGTITDIDKTRLYLKEREQSTAQIGAILAQMPVILFAFDEQGLLCAWNYEAERVTGYTSSEMIGNSEAMKWLCPDPDYRRQMLAAYKERGDDYRNWDWQLTARDGTVKVITFSNIAKDHPIAGWANWGVGVDVTTCRRTEHALRERVKELTCLYKLSMLSNQPDLSLERFFQEVVELLPEPWQYPEITSARIIYENYIFRTEAFAASPWMLSSRLHVRGRQAGLIEIYYSEERPPVAEGPFQIEERLLLDEIALQVSRTIDHVLARQDLSLLHELSAKAEELENFSHTVSHDLKTPLTAIGGFAEFLGKQLAQGNLAQARFCAERIIENTRRMECRLNEILQLARIGRIAAPSQKVDLKSLIEETLGMMATRLAGAQIAVEVDREFPKVLGDPVRLREVIENLLENAMRYIGREPNLISIGCRRQGPEAVFYIKDNGIGIDPQYFGAIFELFRRLDNTIKGDGVGLTIARRIVEAHGGRIWVESAGEGHGACFCFTLGHVFDNPD